MSGFDPAGGGIFGLMLIVFLLYAAILAFFLPFFVHRIRNESIKTNAILGTIADLLKK